MTITLHFNTPVIDSKQRVWIIRPGSGYRLHKDFITRSRIYLEMPDLSFDNGVNELGYNDYIRNISTRDLVRRNANRTLTAQSFYGDNRVILPGLEPVQSLEDHPPSPPSDPKYAKKFGATVGNIGRFIVQMKVGDFVVVPGRGGTRAAVSFGVITSGIDSEKTTQLNHYVGRRTLHRTVKWLRHIDDRSILPDAAFMELTKRRAVNEVRDFDTKIKFYDTVFDNYVVGDRSRALIFARRYKGSDPTALNEMNLLSKFYLAAAACATNDNLEALRTAVDIQNFVNENYSPELLNNYTLAFSSPGQTGVYPSNPVHSLVISGLFAISSAFTMSGCLNSEVTTSGTDTTIEKQEAAYIQQTILETINPKLAADVDSLHAEADKKDLGIETPIDVERK